MDFILILCIDLPIRWIIIFFFFFFSLYFFACRQNNGIYLRFIHRCSVRLFLALARKCVAQTKENRKSTFHSFELRTSNIFFPIWACGVPSRCYYRNGFNFVVCQAVAINTYSRCRTAAHRSHSPHVSSAFSPLFGVWLRKSCQKLFTFIRQMSITRAPPARTRISILHFRRHLLSLAHRSQLAANGPQKWTSKWKRKTFSRSFFCHSNIIFGFGIHRWCHAEHRSECTKFRARCFAFVPKSRRCFGSVFLYPHLLCISR